MHGFKKNYPYPIIAYGPRQSYCGLSCQLFQIELHNLGTGFIERTEKKRKSICVLTIDPYH